MIRNVVRALALACLLACAWSSPGSAQNVICATAPAGSSDNRCASTAFVQGAIAAIFDGPNHAIPVFTGTTNTFRSVTACENGVLHWAGSAVDPTCNISPFVSKVTGAANGQTFSAGGGGYIGGTADTRFLGMLGSQASPDTTQQATAIFQKWTDKPDTVSGENSTVYVQMNKTGSANKAVGLWAEGIDYTGGLSTFVEGGRFHGVLNGGTTTGSAYGAISSAQAYGTGYQYVIGHEADVQNRTGVDAPVDIDLAKLAVGFNAGSAGGNMLDAWYITNPFTSAKARVGFLVLPNSVDQAAFRAIETAVYGLDLRLGTWTASIAAPNFLLTGAPGASQLTLSRESGFESARVGSATNVVDLFANSDTGEVGLITVGVQALSLLTAGGSAVLDASGNLAVSGAVTPGSPIGVAHGGTGRATLTAHAVILGNGTGGVNSVGPCTSGYFLGGTGPSSDPTCQAFTQSGTGAITRTWQSKAADIVNARDFGTVCDGVTDDRAALEAAVTEASSVGRMLMLPAGRCLINTDGGTITLNSVTLLGQQLNDVDSRAISGGPLKGTTFFITGTTNAPFKVQRNVTIDGVGFYYPNQVDSPTPTAYPPTLDFDPTYLSLGFVNIRNSVFYNSWIAIDMTHDTGAIGPIWIENNTILGLSQGIVLGPAGNVEAIYINRNIFTFGQWLDATEGGAAGYVRANARAIVVPTSDGMLIQDNVFFGYFVGLSLASSGSVAQFKASGNIYDSVRFPIYASGSGNLNGQFVGEYINAVGINSSEDGVAVTLNTSGAVGEVIQFVGVRIAGANADGFRITNTAARNVSIQALTATAIAAKYSSGTFAAVNINAANTNVRIGGGEVFCKNTNYVWGVLATSVNALDVADQTYQYCQSAIKVISATVFTQIGNKAYSTFGTTSDDISGVGGTNWSMSNSYDKPSSLSLMPSCSTAASALRWTTNAGFDCNTTIAAATAPVGGITGLGSGIATWLATPSSANLAAAVTDETGSGALVFATSPTLVTPTLGVAAATSINKMAITAPATSATLAIADGKTFTASNSLTLAGTDSTTMTFPATSQTIAGLGVAQTFTTKQAITANSTSGPGGLTIDVTQTQPNSSDTADAGLSLSYTLSASSATNELVPRGFALTFINNLTGGGAITAGRMMNLAAIANSGTTTSVLDNIYMDATSAGTVGVHYGLHIVSLIGATKWGIYDESGANSFFQGYVRADGGFRVSGDTGLSSTISVRKGDDSGACNLVVSGGIITSTTC